MMRVRVIAREERAIRQLKFAKAKLIADESQNSCFLFLSHCFRLLLLLIQRNSSAPVRENVHE